MTLHSSEMFVVSEAEAAAIRAVFHERGEFAAAVELRRLPWHPGYRPSASVRADDRRLEAAAAAFAPGTTAS